MFKFIKAIKDIYNISKRLAVIESEFKELDERFRIATLNYSKQFKDKIEKMSFDYTKNLDDTKSEYLKKYLESRMDCMSNAIQSCRSDILGIDQRMDQYNTLLLEKDED